MASVANEAFNSYQVIDAL